MSKSSIEWTDETWNPVSGCTRVSAGCDNCYAVKMTKRLDAMGQEKYSGLVNLGKGHFNGIVKCHEDTLTIPLKAKKPRRYFVNSMSDLFHKEVPLEFIDTVFAVMALCPQHTFQILTKRPERMAEYLSFVDPGGFREVVWANALRHLRDPEPFRSTTSAVPWPLPNVWLGTSVEDQATADERIPHLLRCPAAVRFLSCEPLLGPVDLSRWLCGANPEGRPLGYCVLCGSPKGFPESHESHDNAWPSCLNPECIAAHEAKASVSFKRSLHWVIVGGESGPGARPMHPNWARSLRDQCVAAQVPFFFKQWGEWAPDDALSGESLTVAQKVCGPNREYVAPNGEFDGMGLLPGIVTMNRVGKHRAGRLLDGRTWDEFPQVPG